MVIVSEERGTISFCFNGNIASNLDGPKLRTMLEAIFSPKVRKKSRKAPAKGLRDGASIDAPLSRRTLDAVSSRRGGDSPDNARLSRRSSELESAAHPRISLAEPEPSPARPRVHRRVTRRRPCGPRYRRRRRSRSRHCARRSRPRPPKSTRDTRLIPTPRTIPKAMAALAKVTRDVVVFAEQRAHLPA